MNRLRLRRSGAALLFPVHYRAGDSIRFLLIAAAGLRNSLVHRLHEPLYRLLRCPRTMQFLHRQRFKIHHQTPLTLSHP